VSDPAKVINALRGLNSKFSHTISLLIARKPLPSLFTHDYLLEEEARQLHTTKMEATSALLTGSSSTPPARPLVRPPLPPAPTGPAPPTSSANKNGGGKNNNKKRKDNDNKKLPSSSPSGGAPLPLWSTPFNPWTGVVQVWLMPIWCPSAPGLLGLHPGSASLPALTADTFQPYGDQQLQAPAVLMATLQAVPFPNQYTGGGDWIMDTGASSYMENNPGILTSSSPSPCILL
jgi:hypothetical protein